MAEADKVYEIIIDGPQGPAWSPDTEPFDPDHIYHRRDTVAYAGNTFGMLLDGIAGVVPTLNADGVGIDSETWQVLAARGAGASSSLSNQLFYAGLGF